MTLQASMLIRRSIASVVFVWAMSTATASANTILSIDPATTTVNVGDTFSVNINIAGVEDLFSYNFDLLFDPDILLFQSITEGAFLTSGGDATFFIDGDGLTTPGIVAFTTSAIFGATGVSGGGTLAIATFEAKMAGETDITFPDQFPFQLLFSDSIDMPIAVSAFEGTVQVNASAVPEEPSTMILLVAAVALSACRCFTRAS